MHKFRKNLFISLFFSFLILGFSFFPILAFAQQASLFLSPNSGTFSVGQVFTVNVKVNSGGSPGINAADGTVKFDADYLKVLSVSTQSSIFLLWTTQPKFSNTLGTITFGGGTPQPYTGSAGTIFSITFKALKSGSAKVSFSNASVLAADGKGTNILGGTSGASFTIGGVVSKPTPTPKLYTTPSKTPIYTPQPETSLLPSLPKIKSLTHPDEDKWYANKNPEFSWDLPADVIAVKLLIGSRPKSLPTVLYSPPIAKKKVDDLPDGIWYFHVRFKNNYGWGPIAHRRIQVDTIPPEDLTVGITQEDEMDPSPKVTISAKDETSGIDYFEISVDGASSTKVLPKEALAGFNLSPQLPGNHTLLAIVYDKAGNKASTTKEFSIKGLNPPIILEMPTRIGSTQALIIKGTSDYPNVKVEIFFEKDGKIIKGETTTNKDGSWTYVHTGKLQKGIYFVWAKVKDKRGAESLSSNKFRIQVAGLPLVKNIWWIIVIILFLVVLGNISFIFYQKNQLKKRKEKIRKELTELKETIERVFIALREELDEDIVKADRKKGLSRAEEEVRDKLREALDVSEELISKNLKDLNEEIEDY